MRSVLVTGAVLNLVFLGLSLFTWLHARDAVEGPRYWLAGFACFTIGIGFVALRGIIPGWISIVVANAVILFGVMIKAIGLLRFFEVRKPCLEASLWAAVAAASVLLGAYYWVWPSLALRMLAMSLANAYLGAAASYVLLTSSPRGMRSHVSMAAIFYGSFSMVYALRAFRALAWRGGENWLSSGDALESWILTSVMVILGGIAVGEMLLLHGKQELALAGAAAELGERNRLLQDEIDRRNRAENELLAINRELGSTQKEIMITLSEVVEFRSKETALHVARVGEYARVLCLAAGKDPDEAGIIADAAPMHDIGKIAVPDDILNKPSGLDPAELSLIRSHTTIGYQLLHKSDRALIKMASVIALEHHEYWDGGGYPDGKKGHGISFAGRVVCLCDVYDALAAARPYKEAWELPRILDYIRAQRGLMFDPELVDAFFLHLGDFLSISETLKDA